MSDVRVEKLQSVIALGWVVMLVLFIAIVVSQLMEAAIADDFTRFAQHPARKGWEVSSLFVFCYGLMPILTKLLGQRWFRWLNALLLAFITFSMLHHQLQHISEGMIYGLTGLIDSAHHIVGVMMVVLAVRWARMPEVYA